MKLRIPLHRPYFGAREIQAAARSLRSRQLAGDGLFTRRVEAKLRRLLKVRYCLLTTSCTHALEMAMMALDVGPGDEVLLPSFTFVSAANAVVRQGARPVFVEVEPDTLNLDPKDLSRKISRRTRVILPTHYGGVAGNMAQLGQIARQRGITIVEDAAHALGASFRGRPLGTFGAIGCLSFHQTKNVSCGEGGAFVTNDDALAHRAEVLREKGTNRMAFVRGKIAKYTWVAVGSSFVPSDLLAAILEAQLSRMSYIQSRRKAIWETYWRALEDLHESGRIQLPRIPADCKINYHIFYFLVSKESRRDEILSKLRERGIGAAFHFVPLHVSPYARRHLGYQPKDLPVTQSVASRLIRLPIYPAMGDRQVRYVIREVRRVLSH